MTSTLAGKTIGVTAERRAHQQQRYLEARGAHVLWAPVLHTVDHTERPEVVAATTAMVDAAPDILVVQTGQGLRWWLDAMGHDQSEALLESLTGTEIWCRGSKATSACKKVGLDVAWQSPLETTADVCDHLVGADLEGGTVALQLDGNDPGPLLSAAAGAETVVALDVYGYRLPTDIGPVRNLVAEILGGGVDAVTFTASPAIRHLRELAATIDGVDRLAELDDAFNSHCLAVLVGPVCAETASEVGWSHFVEPPTARLIPMLETLETALIST